MTDFLTLLALGAVLAIPALIVAVLFRKIIASLASLIAPLMILAILILIGGCGYCVSNGIELSDVIDPQTFTLLGQLVPVAVGFLGTFGILGIVVIGKVSFD